MAPVEGKYPPPRMAFSKSHTLGDAKSHCLIDYVNSKGGELPLYLIFARKTGVVCYGKDTRGNSKSEGGWESQYNKDGDVINLEEAARLEALTVPEGDDMIVGGEVDEYRDIAGEAEAQENGEGNAFESDVETILDGYVPIL